ncbi:MAG: enoyl-CoA hydratase-related protein [Blastocatellia bacterium]
MIPSADSNLLIRREPPLVWLVINRPEARNALTAAMWNALARAMNALSEDDDVRVLILTGAGDKAFIAGADIGELRAMLNNPSNERENYRFTTEALQSLTRSPKPVIAMINGHCLGGGMLLAMSCDLRFAAETARFGIPAARLGVAYPPEQGAARLARIAGAAAASDILLTGRTFDAAEALRLGLVNRVVAAGELETLTRETALEIASCAPLSLAAHKLAIQQSLLPDADRNWKVVEEAVNRCYASEDCREGLSAFLEKRKSEFKGR